MSLGIIDLDGVFANFIEGSFLAHDRPIEEVKTWNYFEAWGITEEEFWEPIHDLGDDFYGEYVPPYDWHVELLDVVKRYTEDQIILTSPSNHPAGYSGKKVWCDKYLPGIKLIVAKDKQYLAGPRRTLIDDNDKNCETFINPTVHLAYPDGHSILFPQLWNNNLGLVDQKVKYVERRLRHIFKTEG